MMLLTTSAPGSKVVSVGNHQVIVAPDANGNCPSAQRLEEDWNQLARVPESAQDLIPFATVILKAELGSQLDATDIARQKAVDALTPQELRDHGEYMLKLADAFRDEYLSRGLTFTGYENATKDNEQLRNEIDSALRARLYADPRAVELMRQFDIPV